MSKERLVCRYFYRLPDNLNSSLFGSWAVYILFIFFIATFVDADICQLFSLQIQVYVRRRVFWKSVHFPFLIGVFHCKHFV